MFPLKNLAGKGLNDIGPIDYTLAFVQAMVL